MANEMRVKPWAWASLALSLLARAADDPNTLVEKARKAHAARDDQKAISLLRKADAAWQNRGPEAPEHVEALEWMALLMKSHASERAEAGGAKGYGADLEEWRSEAAPVVKRALDLCEANNASKPEDVALALELEADVLGRGQDGASFWDRATKIRAERVAEITSRPPPEETVSEADTSVPQQIGDGVSQPAVVAKREPNYTDAARLMRYSGGAKLSVIIDARGFPRHIRLVRGLGYGLDEEAAIAVSTWRFRPAMRDGKPVAVKANIEVNFRLL